MNYRLETLKMMMYAIDFASNNGCPDDLTDRQFSFVQKRLDKESAKLRKRILKLQNNRNDTTIRNSKDAAK